MRALNPLWDDVAPMHIGIFACPQMYPHTCGNYLGTALRGAWLL